MDNNTSTSGSAKKETPHIKRRITQACILCRKKKIKCDGAKPECVHCQEASLQCQYTEYKKRGPHKGYVRLLEERLVQLERRLTSAGAEIPPPISGSCSGSVTSPVLQQHYEQDQQIERYSPIQKQETAQEDDDFPPIEIVTHLIDLFFQYINSVFPFVHRARLKQSIQEGNVSRPLIWGVMAIAARFSDHPSIKTDPPYWAGEKFATKATSLINAALLEPTIPNLQFWGIMSCLEYGRASGSKAWTYGGIAVRICQELGLNKESTLKTPIISLDGTIDYVAMALRRRIFWSVFCIDKFASTSTNRPQGFDIGDYDAEPPTLGESRLLRDPLQGYTLDHLAIVSDPLMDVIPSYIRVLERFGEISKYMSRAKTDTASVTWPPIAEFVELDAMMHRWRRTLPDVYQFTLQNVQKYRDTASQNYLNFWLCSHAMYCTGMLALHRGSLAYSDLMAAELPADTYERIQMSIKACKVNVEMAMDVFKALRDICGCNVLPYVGYCAYIFSTVLMTSAFSSDPASFTKSSSGLAILFDTIKLLRPYWPMSERLAATTRDMLAAHSKLYDVQDQEEYSSYDASNRLLPPNNNTNLSEKKPQPQNNSPDLDSLASIASPEPNTSSASLSYPSFVPNSSNTIIPMQQQQQQSQPQPAQNIMPNSYNQEHVGMNNNDIDFNSCEFLYDSALFGQIIFDSTNNNDKTGSSNDINYWTPQYSILTSMAPTNNTTATMYQPYQ